jgi:hypothetical protein
MSRAWRLLPSFGAVRLLAFGAPLVFFVARAGPARAADPAETEPATCRAAYESAQLRRRDGALLAAREQLRICGAEECPAIARMDCVRWFAEVDADVPSIVFEARTDGGSVLDVTAKVDGAVVATKLDGRPVEIDPGVHVITLERVGQSSVVQTIVVRAGEKNRLVAADWTTPKRPEAPAPRPAAVERALPLGVYATAAVAVLGFADFAVAGGIGDSVKGSLLRDRCAPFCAEDKVDAMRTAYLLADVGLGIGAAGAVTSAFLFFIHANRVRAAKLRAESDAPRGTWRVVPSPSGVRVGWQLAF